MRSLRWPAPWSYRRASRRCRTVSHRAPPQRTGTFDRYALKNSLLDVVLPIASADSSPATMVASGPPAARSGSAEPAGPPRLRRRVHVPRGPGRLLGVVAQVPPSTTQPSLTIPERPSLPASAYMSAGFPSSALLLA